MQHSTIEHPTCSRQTAICVCALAALLAATAAHGRSRTRYAPVISGTPTATDVAGTAYSFTPNASGPSGYALTFSISGKPSWASFNSSTGQLAGTPTTANVGSFPHIVISVRDRLASASLAPFSITVSAPTAVTPTPPAISGTPATTDIIGTTYTFTPQASAPSGDSLSFSVQNKPSWTVFSIASGTLSGTPTTADAGTYSNIVISASDGGASASLPAFSITVNQPASASGTATVTWTAPVANVDGSALTDLAGYHIHYGTSASSLTTIVDVPSPGATTYTLANLASGTWYFAASAYTTSGLESTLSNTLSKSIP